MGLDVRVYSNLKLEKEKNADFKAYVLEKDWEYKIKNLKKNKYYSGDVVFRGISYSYSSHNRFREKLVNLINRTDLLNLEGKIIWDNMPNNIPFYDLINFADNEGCLDWEVSETIYSDFKKFNRKAKKEMNEYDYSSYQEWLETFKISKNKGVVVFG